MYKRQPLTPIALGSLSPPSSCDLFVAQEPAHHRRTYLSEISGEQTKAAVVRRLLGDEQVA